MQDRDIADSLATEDEEKTKALDAVEEKDKKEREGRAPIPPPTGLYAANRRRRY